MASDVVFQLRARERVLLRNLLPKESDLSTIRIVRELRESLEFNEEDLERLHVGFPCQVCGERGGKHGEEHPFVPNPMRIGWDQDCVHCESVEKGHDDSEHIFESKDCPVPLTFGPKALSIVKAELLELSQHKKLTEELLGLCDLFLSEPSKNGAKPTPIKRRAGAK